MPYDHDHDPLDYDKAPSLSFNGKPIGTTYVGKVLAPASLVQSRDFETGDPATWPDGNPKMAVVIKLEVDGELRSLWAAKPSAMFAALVAAQKEAGQRIGEGGTLHVKYTGDVPNAKNPRLNAAKQYACRYTPPVNDVFGEEFAPPVPAKQANPRPSMQNMQDRATENPQDRATRMAAHERHSGLPTKGW